MQNNVKMEISDFGKKRLDEIVDETYEWMGGENTVGDFITALFERMVEEVLGEDICSMSVSMVDNDEKSRMKILEKLSESPMLDMFVKANKAEQLARYMV